jgi:hypothetical protein
VAVLRLHATPTGHVSKGSYSCVRGMYVLQRSMCLKAPNLREGCVPTYTTFGAVIPHCLFRSLLVGQRRGSVGLEKPYTLPKLSGKDQPLSRLYCCIYRRRYALRCCVRLTSDLINFGDKDDQYGFLVATSPKAVYGGPSIQRIASLFSITRCCCHCALE